ncbi:MAG: DUF1189 domain-containing protein [Kineothrix sp.]|nr:hypothetical protein C807_02483 [Lachnospiraceae bacterium 28-4]MCX4345013.1 DUF1189 domain-containing protein [Kineothrix sp.]
MNIFREMSLSVYSFKSYKEFLNNRKSKVFLFAIVVMLIYFVLTIIVPFFQLGSGLGAMIREEVPDFELSNGVLWVDEIVQIDDGSNCIWVDTNPDEVFYDASEMESYYAGYINVILMDSEKVIIKNSSSAMQQYRFDELGINFSKDDLEALVPSMYFIIVVVMIITYVVMTMLFFFGVLFVALIGMIVASSMKYQLTFGQLYLLGIYSRVLPLLIKACVSWLPFTIPYFWIINFGISVVILGVVIKGMKTDLLQQQMNQGNQGNHYSFDDRTWM